MANAARKIFGKIIEALRKERITYTASGTARSWTRKYLADKANLSFSALRDIESGKKATIRPDEIINLSNALQLTTHERLELILAASFVQPKDVLPDCDKGDEPLKHLLPNLQQSQLPAYIVDVYGDVVAANDLIVNLFGFSQENLKYGIGGNISRYNIMRVIFSQDLDLRQRWGASWKKIAEDNILFFRGESLRYRHTKYWHMLFKELIALKDFEDFWRNVPEKECFPAIRQYTMQYTDTIRLSYLSVSTVVLTEHGNLRFIVYVPTDEKTLNIFLDLKHNMRSSSISYKIAPWPDKFSQPKTG